MDTEVHNENLLRKSLLALNPIDAGVILVCSARRLGDRGLWLAIKATANEHGADPVVVLAAFGWLPNAKNPWAGEFVDVLNNPRAIGEIDPANTAQRAAWAIARIVAGRHGAGTVAMQKRPDKADLAYLGSLRTRARLGIGEVWDIGRKANRQVAILGIIKRNRRI